MNCKEDLASQQLTVCTDVRIAFRITWERNLTTCNNLFYCKCDDCNLKHDRVRSFCISFRIYLIGRIFAEQKFNLIKFLPLIRNFFTYIQCNVLFILKCMFYSKS